MYLNEDGGDEGGGGEGRAVVWPTIVTQEKKRIISESELCIYMF